MNFDAAIYRANPNDAEKDLDPKKIAILIVTFDNLKLKKTTKVAEFARMQSTLPGDWMTVLPHVAPAIRRTAGDNCITATSSLKRPCDIRLHVSTPHIESVIQNLETGLAAYNLTLKRTARA